MKHQIVKNIASNYALNFFGLGLGFILVPFLLGRLGKEAFGLIVLAESMIGFFEIGTISVRVALSRHVAFSLGRGRKEEFLEYLATGRGLLFVSAGLVVVLGGLLGMFFPQIFRVPATEANSSRILFLLLVFSFACTVPNIVYWSVLYAKERFDLINMASSVGLLLRAVLLFGLYTFIPESHRSIAWYGVAFFVMTLVQNVMVYVWHRKVMPDTRIDLKMFRKSRVREILSFSGHTSIARLSTLLYDNTANVLINLLWGPAANAVYSVSLRLPQILKRVFVDSTWTLTPTFTNLAARDEREKSNRLFFLYTKAVALLTLPICFALMLFAIPIMTLWVGPDFHEAGRLLPIHLAPLVVSIPLAVCGCITNAHAKVKLPSLVSLTLAVVNLGLAALLGLGLNWGLYGVATAASLTSLVYFTVFTPFYACRIARVPLVDYWTQAFLKPLAWAGVVCVAAYAVLSGLAEVGLVFLSLAVAPLFAAAYAYGAYRWVLMPDERARARDVLRGPVVQMLRRFNLSPLLGR